ncbi:MAG: dioxygenase [Bryobacteraceae bacterium]|nr:dioxygenase [Bryobacteraceae bacterium]
MVFDPMCGSFSRRRFVRGGALTLAALAESRSLLYATPEIQETEDNQEGPYYKPGAPIRSNLVEKGMPGTRLLLTGKVLGLDGKPLPNAEIDLWQADANGQYDNIGFRLRGRVFTNDSGLYQIETIIPRHYGAGSYPRPPHLHVKVRKGDGPVLTTQLYFRGNPYNYHDPSVRPSLLLDLKDNGGNGKSAEFQFVIRTA